MQSKRSAFTLVELLVVIGIISLLISILLPSLERAREAAQEVVCESNLRQFGLGIQMYVNQNDGFLPQKGPDGSGPGPNSFSPAGGVTGYNDPSIWFNAIPPLVKRKSYYQMLVDASKHIDSVPAPGGSANIFECPTASPPAAYPGGRPDIISPDGPYYMLWGRDSDPNDGLMNSTGLIKPGQFPFNMSYVWNSKLTSAAGKQDSPTIKMCQCRPSDEVVLMLEKMQVYGEYRGPVYQQYAATPAGQYKYAGLMTAFGYDNKIAQPKACWTRFTTRHRGGGHILFADGHVGWFSWLDVQIPNDPAAKSSNEFNANQPGKIIWCPLGPTN